MMLSTMMDVPLTVQQILWRIERLYPGREVVTAQAEGAPVRTTYGDIAARVARLASALQKAGVQQGERVATFGWNTQRHLECYFAIPSMGAVLHTLNVRLFQDQLEYIINHAEDGIIFCDRSVLPLLEALAGKIPTVRLVVLMNAGGEPSGALPTVDYEEFLATGDATFAWPELDERSAAAMCYTSGTTGNPKGVVYSHRSTVLHSLVAAQPNNINIGERDTVMFAVPMFHANAWGIPYTAAFVGAAQVYTDRFLDPQRVTDLIANEKVTISAGVPTIWIGVLSLLDGSGRELPSLHTVLCGGSAAPPALIAGLLRHNIHLLHAWGMTETSPLASLTRLKAGMELLSPDEQLRILSKQGILAPLVEGRIVDLASNEELPWDGVAFGELQVRGPWVTSTYYNDPEAEEKFMTDAAGRRWLRTGDVASIDADGYIQLVDRTKDLVKSGGEWISSVELENLIMAHPCVLEAAVVGIAHPRWDERPVAAVVVRPGQADAVDAAAIKLFLSDKVAKWWLPDEVVFVEEIPKTSVGKFSKKQLRDRLSDVAERWAAQGI
jgi:fatty-acyl-CoA synthase